MIDPNHYSYLPEVLEWKWPERPQAIYFDRGQPPRIQWLDGQLVPSDAEINQAAEDWLASRRQPKTEAELVSELDAWLLEDVARIQKALAVVLAKALVDDPMLLRRHGLVFDGDKPLTN